MFEKLMLMEEKYEEINRRLSDPDVVSDMALYTELMKEYKSLTPIIEKYREYKKAVTEHEESQELLEDSDSEIREMAHA